MTAERSSNQRESDFGESAARVLAEPAFHESLERMKAECMQALKETPIRDLEGLQLAAISARITDKVERVLLGILEAGKAADARIRLDSERKESQISRPLRRAGS